MLNIFEKNDEVSFESLKDGDLFILSRNNIHSRMHETLFLKASLLMNRPGTIAENCIAVHGENAKLTHPLCLHYVAEGTSVVKVTLKKIVIDVNKV